MDMTSRKLQNEFKDQGHPWLLQKGFDTSCPCKDLFLTGTPAGVGPVKRGDQIEAGMNGDNDFRYSMKFNVS